MHSISKIMNYMLAYMLLRCKDEPFFTDRIEHTYLIAIMAEFEVDICEVECDHFFVFLIGFGDDGRVFFIYHVYSEHAEYTAYYGVCLYLLS